MFFTYTLIAFVTLCCAIYYYLTRTFSYWKRRNVRGPKPLPLFGNLLESSLRKKNIAVVYKEIYDQFPNEKVAGIYRMTTPCLLLRDLDIIKHVLIKDFDYFSDRGVSVSDKGLGLNLFHTDAHRWRLLRNRFSPIFSSGKLKNMIYLLEERADKFLDYLQEQCELKSEFDVHMLFQKYTMAAISACAFGLDVDTLSDKMDFFEKLYRITTDPSIVDELDMMFPGVLKKMDLDIFPKPISEFFLQLVSTVIKQRNGVPSNRNDFMDLILDMRQQGYIQGTKKHDDTAQVTVELTDDVIATQAFVFYTAGYETSASTIGFMLYEMAKNQEIQDKVLAEVDEVLKKHEGKITFETLSDMSYVDMVFDETLRMYPVLNPLQRRAQIDYKLPGTDIIVKKDTIVIIPIQGIHHDAKHWPNPEKFDPERFSPENANNRHSCAYIPFGNGPRNCIGMRFAKVQSLVALIKFFSKFRVEPCSKTVSTMSFVAKRIIIAADGGIPLNVIPRNNNNNKQISKYDFKRLRRERPWNQFKNKNYLTDFHENYMTPPRDYTLSKKTEFCKSVHSLRRNQDTHMQKNHVFELRTSLFLVVG